MATRRFKRLALAQLLGVGCAVVLAAGLLIELAQAQQQFAPAPPPPPPVFNPPSPNRTVPQPGYTPVTPSTPSVAPGNDISPPAIPPETTPAKETKPPRTTPRESEQTPVAKTRSFHHRYRGYPAPVTYRCGPYGWGFYGCVRTYTWAFPCQYYSSYCGPYYVHHARYYK
jgi:hypothetical protein